MKHFFSFKYVFLGLTLIMTISLLAGPASAQQSGRLRIHSLDPSQFPDIRLRFQAFDENGAVMGGLTPEDLSLMEQGTPIEDFSMVPVEGGAVRVVYIVDLGRFANFNTLGLARARQAMTELVDGDHFLDGEDVVEILARASDGQTDETLTLLEPTSSAEEFTSFVRSMDFDGTAGTTRALEAVEGVLDETADPEGPDHPPTFIVLLTHIIERPAGNEAEQQAQELGARARDLGIPVFVLQSRLGDEADQPLRTLASASGGSYLDLQRNVDQVPQLNEMYSTIDDQRLAHEITYRSSNGDSGSRTVTLDWADDSQEETPVGIAYEVELQPAEIQIVEPGAGEAISMATGETEDEASGAVAIQVIGRVQSWPDGYPREIETVTLLADGDEVAAPGTSSEGQLRLDWTPASVEEATEVELQLLATDELGIQATSASRTVTLTPAEASGGFIASCLDDPLQLSCMAIVLIPVLLIGVLLIVLAGVGVIAFSGKDKDEGQVAEAPEKSGLDQTLVPGADWASGGEDKDLLAQLEVLSGPPEKIGLRLPIEDYVTNIGRDPDQVDIAFFPEGNTSVSGHHCTLQLYYGTFYLTDKNSTNGTRVNGQRLTADEAHEIKEGDEIVLGDPSLRGVKLRFHRSGSIDRKRGLDETQIEADLEDMELEGGATEIWVDEDEEDSDSWMEELE